MTPIDITFNHACGSSAATPVQYITPVRHCSIMSPFQTCTTMKGNVWTSARANMVQLIQRWKTWSFSWEMPDRRVM